MNNENLKENDEFAGGSLNNPYIPDTFSPSANRKIRRLMVEHYVSCDFKVKNIELLFEKIKEYCSHIGITLRNIEIGEPDPTAFFVINLYLNGTTYHKKIRQGHIDNYVLELSQLKDNMS